MTSRCKKLKKKGDLKVKATNIDSKVTEKPMKSILYTYFTNSDVCEVRSALKLKEITSIPLVLAATVLNRVDILKTLINNGHYDPNEVNSLKISPLLWAIKNKNLDLIELLLDHGGNPIDNGEHILIIAAENKSWDEDLFIPYWKIIKLKSWEMELNPTSTKNNHNLLHLAVRRDWLTLVTILIDEKVDVDAKNSNGVTALMMACCRNNSEIAEVLIDAEADVMLFDNHGRLALSYAISSFIKAEEPIPTLVDLLIEKLPFSFDQYLRQCFFLVLAEKSDFPTESFVNMLNYTVQYTDDGLRSLEYLDFVPHLNIRCHTSRTNFSFLTILLTMAAELLFYNDQVPFFDLDEQTKLLETIINTDIPDICLDLIQEKQNENCVTRAFYFVMLLSTCNNELSQNWYRAQFSRIQELHSSLTKGEYLNKFQQDFPDENRLRLVKKRMKKFKKYINNTNLCSLALSFDIEEAETKPNTPVVFECPKKTKRRSKSIKAKLAKIKSAELTERLQLNLKKKVSEESVPSVKTPRPAKIKKKESEVKKPEWKVEKEVKKKKVEVAVEENPISKSLLAFLEKNRDRVDEKKIWKNRNPFYPDWKLHIINLSFEDSLRLKRHMFTDKDKLREASLCLKKLASNKNLPPRNVHCMIDIIVNYLAELLKIIIETYQTHWENDKKDMYNLFFIQMLALEETEKKLLDNLVKSFKHLTNVIKEKLSKNMAECFRNLNQLEDNLLNYKIRNKSILSEIGNLEQIEINHSYCTELEEKNNFLLKYMEDVLNDRLEPRDDLQIDVVEIDWRENLSTSPCPQALYESEMAQLPPKGNPMHPDMVKANMARTMAYAYHLWPSIDKWCNDDAQEARSKKAESIYDFSEILLRSWSNRGEPNRFVSREAKAQSRWQPLIKSLQSLNGEGLVDILCGDLKVCKAPEKMARYMVSQNGNFNKVLLGLTKSKQPFAVKRIPRDNTLCMKMKSLINPLLGLRNAHILQYYICDYEENDLILATPLCEFNMGQFVLLMKESLNNNYFNLTAMEVVRQLLMGLMFLHERKEPIVHGNLKPSNIFVDLKGVVRVAEFGIHEAVFKIEEAPKSSLIWFSLETFRIFKQMNTVYCTKYSDVQVAGMLIYFILSGGIHPYGSNVIAILKNMEKATMKVPLWRDLIFGDIVSWMMMVKPIDRPNVKQVLAHVIFWSTQKKWKFVMLCAGINCNNTNQYTIDMDRLHKAIDLVSAQENIKANWMDVLKTKYPAEICHSEDTVTGLLRFIKNYYEKHSSSEMRAKELCNDVLSYFPAFPLSLYRILEATHWLDHPLFINYTLVDFLHN